MFSKSILVKKIGLFLFAALIVTMAGSCSQFLDDSKKENEVLEIKDGQFSCINSLPDSFKSLSIGESNPADIEKTMGCLKRSLAFFNERTKGSFAQGYSPEDLRKFFGKYFLKQNNLSLELTNSLMKLKQTLFGGDEGQLTKQELVRVIQFLDPLKEELINISPNLKLLLFKNKKQNVDSAQISIAVGQLQISLSKLFLAVDISRSDYQFEDLEKLAAGLYDFIAPGTQVSSFEVIKKWLPFVKSVKNIILGEKPELIHNKDWLQSLETMMQLYKLSLMISYNPLKFEIADQENVKQLFEIGDLLVDLIDRSFSNHRNNEISFELIDEMIRIGYDLNIFTHDLRLETTQDFYKKVIEKVLDNGAHPRGLYSLTWQHWQVLKSEYVNLRVQQSYINQLFLSVVDVQRGISDIEFQKQIQKSEFSLMVSSTVQSAGLRGLILSAHRDLLGLWQKSRPVKFTESGDILFTYDLNQVPWTWRGLTRSSLMFTFTRIFMQGYSQGDGVSLPEKSVSEKLLSSWYDDYHDFLIELKALDPRSPNAGPRSLKEANFFTLSGNGDRQMSFTESYEFISNLFSAGFGNTNRLTKKMKELGCALLEKDIFGNPYFDEKCFIKELRKNYSEIFPNLPYQSKFVSMLNDDFWNQYYNSVMATARVNPKLAGLKIETGDIRTMVMLFHYIECLYTTYDTNKNGYLDLFELRQASVRFADFISTQVPHLPFGQDLLVQESFVALVAMGKKPTATDMARFKWDEMWHHVSPVSRINLLKVIVSLKDNLKSSAN